MYDMLQNHVVRHIANYSKQQFLHFTNASLWPPKIGPLLSGHEETKPDLLFKCLYFNFDPSFYHLK